jgi:hypothetical protein
MLTPCPSPQLLEVLTGAIEVGNAVGAVTGGFVGVAVGATGAAATDVGALVETLITGAPVGVGSQSCVGGEAELGAGEGANVGVCGTSSRL